MKKILLFLFINLIIAQGSLCIAETSTSQSIFSNLKDAIVKDVTNSVTTSVNNVKLANYKTQLEEKKKELEEVENSDSLAIIKYFKKASINQKISDLEAKIEAIEESNS